MKKTALCFLYILLAGLPAVAQSDVDDYSSTFTYGINFNTNGGTIGGGNIKFTQIVRPRLFKSWGLEIVALKHPQEQRVAATGTTSSFIFAKRNYLYSIRPTFGYDYLIFRKAPEESVQVSANFAVGPSIAVEVPYYVIWLPNGGHSEPVIVPYDPLSNPKNEIQGTGGIFRGLGEAKIIPSLFARAGVSLEFGEFRNNITGLEVGFTGEFFSRTPNILEPLAFGLGGGSTPLLKNPRYMIGAYFTVFLGSRK